MAYRRNPPVEMDGIASVLRRALSRVGLERELDDYRILQMWDEVVGPTIARNAQPTRLDTKRLVVVVRSAAWLQELGMLRRELCEKLNTAMGRSVISEIFLVVGRIDDPHAGRADLKTRRKPTDKAGAGTRRVSEPKPGNQKLDAEAHGLSGSIAEAFEKLWSAKRRGGGDTD